MTTKTSREIIRNAYFYANVKNAAITDFYYNTQLLNSAYSSLYTDIVRETNAYVKYVDFTRETDLPNDCYLVLAVYRLYSDGSMDELQMMPKDQRLDGDYYRIENGTLYIGDGSFQSTNIYRLKYSSMPPTLTAPDEPQEVKISYSALGQMTDKGLYYALNDLYYFYSFEDNAIEEVEESDYKAYEEPDLTSYALDNLTIESGATDDPYAAVTYSNGDTYIWTGDNYALYNIEQIHGHKTNVKVLRLKTDDMTGKGLLYEKDGKLWYASFVPDTVLSYPSQIYFTVLEYRLASILSSLNGMDNRLLEEKLIPEAEVKLYETMKESTKPYRLANTMRHIWL